MKTVDRIRSNSQKNVSSVRVTRGKLESNKKSADGAPDFSCQHHFQSKKVPNLVKKKKDFHECARHNWLSGSPIMAPALASPRKKDKKHWDSISQLSPWRQHNEIDGLQRINSWDLWEQSVCVKSSLYTPKDKNVESSLGRCIEKKKKWSISRASQWDHRVWMLIFEKKKASYLHNNPL